ncbi:MAG: hypothetical protein AB2693_19485 [Candidatus Thiodiazotropha sp.]
MKEPSNSSKSTPVKQPEDITSKKRELSSPFSPEDKLSKKNKAESDSESDSDPESVIDMSTVDAMEFSEQEPEVMSQTHMLTLPEGELRKLSDIMRPAIHSDVLASVRDELKSIMKTAMDENLCELNSEITRLTSENVSLKERVVKLEQALDDAEQYSRRNCLRISQFPEEANESTDGIVMKIADTLKVNISPADIDRSHRIGKPGARIRDVIVKFATYRARERLYTQRAGLKQSDLKGIFLNEDLTKLRSKLLYDARRLVKSQPPCLQGAWSTDGRFLVKDLRGIVHRISSNDDFEAVRIIRAGDQV